MKARYNKRKNWAAVYYRKLDCWVFTKVITRGKRKGKAARSYENREITKFETHFEKAKSEARNANGNIPASGWIKSNCGGNSVDELTMNLFNMNA